MNEPENRNEQENRNPDGTFKKGVSGNPGGRPANSMKDYLKRKFSSMSDEEKELWLEEHKVSGIDQFKMAEGNPKQDNEVNAVIEDKRTLVIVKDNTQDINIAR